MATDKRIQIAITDEVNGPGTGGQRLSYAAWVRFPGGPWIATSERSWMKIRKVLASIGIESDHVSRDIDIGREVAR